MANNANTEVYRCHVLGRLIVIFSKPISSYLTQGSRISFIATYRPEEAKKALLNSTVKTFQH